MNAKIKHLEPEREFFIDEGCHIIELVQSGDDPHLSIARARVAPKTTTRWHLLVETVERYVILEGSGRVEVGDLTPQQVHPGDAVLIPASCRQRISNTGEKDLIFLAICTPPFQQKNYQDVEI